LLNPSYHASTIDRFLFWDFFEREPIHPKRVEGILGIAARERLRWTKDGRLPRSGSVSIPHGEKVVRLPHPAKHVAQLWREPNIIRVDVSKVPLRHFMRLNARYSDKRGQL
jgi:hypothetical protein